MVLKQNHFELNNKIKDQQPVHHCLVIGRNNPSGKIIDKLIINIIFKYNTKGIRYVNDGLYTSNNNNKLTNSQKEIYSELNKLQQSLNNPDPGSLDIQLI